MANNTLSFIDMVALGSLKYMHEETQFISNVDRQYDKYYAKDGAKIGSTLRVTYPVQYSTFSGPIMSVQDTVEREASIVQASQKGTAFEFSSKEMTLDTSKPKEVAAFTRDRIYPAMAQLSAEIEAEGIELCTKAVSQTVGTPGTALTTLEIPGLARAKMNQHLAPKQDRIYMIDSVTMSQIVQGTAAYFNDQKSVSEGFKEGFYKRTSMADWYECEKMYVHTNGSDVAISTDAAALVVDGSDVIDFHTLTAAQVAIGSVFTIAGVYDVHPETKKPLGYLKQWSLKSGGATTGSSTLYEKIYLTGPYKNCGTITGADLTPASFNAQVMTFVGAASTSYRQGLMFHPKAFQFVSAPLASISPNPDEFSTKNFEGLSVSVARQMDITNYRQVFRLDVLYGWAALRPEWACRTIGSAF